VTHKIRSIKSEQIIKKRPIYQIDRKTNASVLTGWKALEKEPSGQIWANGSPINQKDWKVYKVKRVEINQLRLIKSRITTQVNRLKELEIKRLYNIHRQLHLNQANILKLKKVFIVLFGQQRAMVLIQNFLRIKTDYDKKVEINKSFTFKSLLDNEQKRCQKGRERKIVLNAVFDRRHRGPIRRGRGPRVPALNRSFERRSPRAHFKLNRSLDLKESGSRRSRAGKKGKENSSIAVNQSFQVAPRQGG
jgi:hypothetical protein